MNSAELSVSNRFTYVNYFYFVQNCSVSIIYMELAATQDLAAIC